MTAFTTNKGGLRMDLPASQTGSASANLTFTRKPIVDWSEETIVVNGSPITVIFPDEDKPIQSDE